jgi:histidyl-tRNA synthetase
MFRYERPQLGRQREFFQFGVEILSENSSLIIDFEIINFINNIFIKFGLDIYQLRINFFGSSSTKLTYQNYLTTALIPIKNELCSLCQTNVYQNIFRILECKRCLFVKTKIKPISDFYQESENNY